MCGISFYFFECYCTYSRNFDRSGRASGRDKASTASKGRSNKFVPRNRSRNRLKTRKGSQDRDNSAPYLLRFVRECVEKYTCNRSTASLVYACHANAYARHVRSWSNGPESRGDSRSSPSSCSCTPDKREKEKNYLPITDRATESVVSRSYPNSVSIYLDARLYIAMSRVHTSFLLAITLE